MQYGKFSQENREYVITEPLTPRPWINYLSNGKMGAFVSQSAGGLAWFEQPVSRRISRYDFMGMPEDRPGFYVYVREKDGTYWNPSFQPCQTPLDHWECRHGMGYTTFIAERDGLKTELKMFVPVDDDVLLLDLKIINNRNYEEELFVSNYLEFSLFEYYREILGWIVLRNQVKFLYDKKLNCIKYHYFAYEAPYTNPVFIATSCDSSGFECSRDKFIGRGRDTSNPIAIENGSLSNTELSGGGLGIGSLAYDVRLKPGESKRISWIVGASQNWDDAENLIKKYQDVSNIDRAANELKTFWDNLLNTYQVQCPDPEIENMINTWNPYGAYVTFFRDRDISTELPGLSSGIRFRDAMQNTLSVCNIKPETARERINLLLKHQWADGSTPNSFLLDSGAQKAPQNMLRCDSPVWSPITVYNYLSETGDFAYLDHEIPYLDNGSATVYSHLMAGLHQIARDSGDNGLPLLKGRDWDDHLSLFSEEGAESVMTAQNWCYAARLMKEICLKTNKQEDAEWLEGQISKYKTTLNGPAWDGEWYRQILFRNGKTPLGSKDRLENKIYINTQAWAVISGTAPEERAALSLDKMKEYLDSPVGIKFLTPPYTGIPEPEDPLVSNGPGLGENGGVFVQANCWAIMAETMLGRGDQAWEYYRKIAPPVISESVGSDNYLNEPYMYSSHIVAEPDSRVGMANLSWLTGAVNWMYVVATQYILEIRPTLDGLIIKPAIPKAWDGFKVKRKLRGVDYNIFVINEHKDGKIHELTVNGKTLDSNLIPLDIKEDKIEVKVLI